MDTAAQIKQIHSGAASTASPPVVLSSPIEHSIETKPSLLHSDEASKELVQSEGISNPKPSVSADKSTETLSPSPVIVKRKRGRPKKNSAAPSPIKRASPKVCKGCGTVAATTRSKKCQKCHMFFFDYWAKRCKIPPCEKCHFSRKSINCRTIPEKCERCGHPLVFDMDDNSSCSTESRDSFGGDDFSDVTERASNVGTSRPSTPLSVTCSLETVASASARASSSTFAGVLPSTGAPEEKCSSQPEGFVLECDETLNDLAHLRRATVASEKSNEQNDSIVAASSKEQVMEDKADNSVQNTQGDSCCNAEGQQDEVMDASSNTVEHIVCSTESTALGNMHGSVNASSPALNSHMNQIKVLLSTTESGEKPVLGEDSCSSERIGEGTKVEVESIDSNDHRDSQMQAGDEDQDTKPMKGEAFECGEMESPILTDDLESEIQETNQMDDGMVSSVVNEMAESSDKETEIANSQHTELSTAQVPEDELSSHNYEQVQLAGKSSEANIYAGSSTSSLDAEKSSVISSSFAEKDQDYVNLKFQRVYDDETKSELPTMPQDSVNVKYQRVYGDQTKADFPSASQDYVNSKFQRVCSDQTKSELPVLKRKLKPRTVLAKEIPSASASSMITSNETLKLRRGNQNLSEMIQQLLLQQSKIIEKRISEKKHQQQQHLLQQQMLLQQQTGRPSDTPFILAKRRKVEELSVATSAIPISAVLSQGLHLSPSSSAPAATVTTVSVPHPLAAVETSQESLVPAQLGKKRPSSALSILSETAEAIANKIDALQKLLPPSSVSMAPEQLSVENITSKITELFPSLGSVPLHSSSLASSVSLLPPSQLSQLGTDSTQPRTVSCLPPPLLKVSATTPAPAVTYSTFAAPQASAAASLPPPSLKSGAPALDRSSYPNEQQVTVDEGGSARTRPVVFVSASDWEEQGSSSSQVRARGAVIVPNDEVQVISARMPATKNASSSSKRMLFKNEAQMVETYPPTTDQSPPPLSPTNSNPHWIDLSSSSQDSISAHSKIRVSMLPNKQSDMHNQLFYQKDVQTATDEPVASAKPPRKVGRPPKHKKKPPAAMRLSPPPQLLSSTSDTSVVYVQPLSQVSGGGRRIGGDVPRGQAVPATHGGPSTLVVPPPKLKSDHKKSEADPESEIISTATEIDRSLTSFRCRMQNKIHQTAPGANFPVQNFASSLTTESAGSTVVSTITASTGQANTLPKTQTVPSQFPHTASSALNPTTLPAKHPGRVTITVMGNKGEQVSSIAPYFANTGRAIAPKPPPPPPPLPPPPPTHDWPLRSRSRGVTVTVTNTFHPVNPLLAAASKRSRDSVISEAGSSSRHQSSTVQAGRPSRALVGYSHSLPHTSNPDGPVGGLRSKRTKWSSWERDDYSKLISDETLCDSEHSDDDDGGLVIDAADLPAPPSDSGGDQGGQQQGTSDGRRRRTRRRKTGEEPGAPGEGGEGGEGSEDSNRDDSPPRKRKRKKTSQSNGKMKDFGMYSVKLKDCFLHHLMWDTHRMVLIVPHTVDTKSSKDGDGSDKPGSTAGGEGDDSLPIGQRRSRRKPKIETLPINEIEEELDPLLESPSLSSSHVNTPCFLVYEMRHKLYSDFSSNTVYVYTYRNRIRTLKLPLHWSCVVKRMGGMQETCHTCRLLDVDDAREMCRHHNIDVPDTVASLSQNILPKGRTVIDLSSVEPEDLEIACAEKVPNCPFVVKKAKKKSSKKKATAAGDNSAKPKRGSSKVLANEVLSHLSEDETGDGCTSPHPAQSLESHDYSRDQSRDQSPELEDRTAPYLAHPPPLIKHEPLSPGSKSPLSRSKKVCPSCGASIPRKSKKCPLCLRNFGVFAFGRKRCTCGRVNLARMSTCYKCGRNLNEAPLAVPKSSEDGGEGKPLEGVFGARKRKREVGSSSTFFGSNRETSALEGFSQPSAKPQSYHRLSNADTEEGSVEMNDVFFGGGKAESSSSALSPPPLAKIQAKLKHAGYQYGRIPWSDADITVLLDDRNIPKFCLQELCSKVLHGHAKADVFDIVKDLHLPIKSGDGTLLKKLQALGLHSNRSPICKLIAAEDLWALLDALQEPVPEEVHQHLDNIGSSTSPLMSPVEVRSQPAPEESQPAPPPPPPAQKPPLTPTIMVSAATAGDEEEHGFESTLHEVECSDGQYVSVLRAWNGEQYACLTEVWKKYFPEVNRNNLTATLKRKELETHMPTGQQATLLRAAGVISLRGAAGRLMKLEDIQVLLDDFGLPLQIGNSSSTNEKRLPRAAMRHPVAALKMTRRVSSTLTSPSNTRAATPHPVPQTSKEDLELAACMRNLLMAVEPDQLAELLQLSHQQAVSSLAIAEKDNNDVFLELDSIQQLIHSRRELCSVMSREMGFLTATSHCYMAELVRLVQAERQEVHELDTVLQAMGISL